MRHALYVRARLVVGAVWCALAVPAAAHDGPRIYLGTSQGQWPHLTTLSGPDAPPAPTPLPPFDLYDVAYKFTSPARYAESISAHRYLTEFPGFSPISTSELGQNDQVGIRFLDAPDVWDGSRFVRAAATFRITGTTPEYESTDFVISRGGMAEAQNYWRIDNTLATTTHGHLAFYLLGDGQNFVAGADGIYRLAAELKVTPGDLGAPLFPAIAPFSILFQVDRWAADDPAQPAPFPDTDADLAAAFAHADLPRAAVRGVVVSPEPSGLSLLGLSGGILLRRRKS